MRRIISIQKDGIRTKSSCAELLIVEMESCPLETYFYRHVLFIAIEFSFVWEALLRYKTNQ